MKKDFGLMLAEARVFAGYTQEQASEQMDITARTLGYYELNVYIPPPKQMIKMIKLYNSELIGYEWLRLNPVGAVILPELKDNSLAEKGLCFLMSLNEAEQYKNDVITICLDNIVDNNEQPTYKRIIEISKKWLENTLAFRFYKANKKSRTARNGSTN